MTKKMQCIDCMNWSMRDDVKMASLGYGRCKFDMVGSYRHGMQEHECKKQDQSSDVAKREEWFIKIKQERVKK